MGSLLRRFKGLKVINMLRLVFVVAFASAAPLEDTPEVAEAKAAFKAAFDAAAAGGLAAKQAPAPVHVLPEPVAAPVVAPTVVPAAINYANIPAVYPYFGYNHVLPQLPYALPAFGLTGLPYNGLPIIA